MNSVLALRAMFKWNMKQVNPTGITSDFLLKKSEESCSISWNPVSPHSMKNVTEGYTKKNITNL